MQAAGSSGNSISYLPHGTAEVESALEKMLRRRRWNTRRNEKCIDTNTHTPTRTRRDACGWFLHVCWYDIPPTTERTCLVGVFPSFRRRRQQRLEMKLLDLDALLGPGPSEVSLLNGKPRVREDRWGVKHRNGLSSAPGKVPPKI